MDRAPAAIETVDWGDGRRFRATAYLGGAMPPLAFVTSARAVVLRGGEVLVQHDRTRRHVVPGGRREPGEAPEATLAREIREETGWSLREAATIGFLHYRHLAPRPPDYAYPYPDLVQVVYAGRAARFSPDAKLDDGFEVGSVFLPVAEARAIGLGGLESVLLEATVARRGWASGRRAFGAPRADRTRRKDEPAPGVPGAGSSGQGGEAG